MMGYPTLHRYGSRATVGTSFCFWQVSFSPDIVSWLYSIHHHHHEPGRHCEPGLTAALVEDQNLTFGLKMLNTLHLPNHLRRRMSLILANTSLQMATDTLQ